MEKVIEPVSQPVVGQGQVHEHDAERRPTGIHQQAQQPPNCREVIHEQRQTLSSFLQVPNFTSPFYYSTKESTTSQSEVHRFHTSRLATSKSP